VRACECPSLPLLPPVATMPCLRVQYVEFLLEMLPSKTTKSKPGG
jgi:hypothetical protein